MRRNNNILLINHLRSIACSNNITTHHSKFNYSRSNRRLFAKRCSYYPNPKLKHNHYLYNDNLLFSKLRVVKQCNKIPKKLYYSTTNNHNTHQIIHPQRIQNENEYTQQYIQRFIQQE